MPAEPVPVTPPKMSRQDSQSPDPTGLRKRVRATPRCCWF